MKILSLLTIALVGLNAQAAEQCNVDVIAANIQTCSLQKQMETSQQQNMIRSIDVYQKNVDGLAELQTRVQACWAQSPNLSNQLAQVINESRNLDQQYEMASHQWRKSDMDARALKRTRPQVRFECWVEGDLDDSNPFMSWGFAIGTVNESQEQVYMRALAMCRHCGPNGRDVRQRNCTAIYVQTTRQI